MNIAQFDEIEMAYKEHTLNISYFVRVGEGETLLNLHGLGSTKYDFFEALNRPEFDSYTLAAFDLPGCGKSSYPTNAALDIADLAEITKQVIEALKLTDVTVIGHSLGGITGLLLAQRYTKLVQRFINVEGNITPEDAGIFSRRTAAKSLDDFVKSLDQFLGEFASLPYIGARIFADTVRQNVTPKVFHDYCASIVAHSDSGQLFSYFTELSIPRKFVFGAANESLSYIPSLGQYGIVVNKVPNSHHWCFLDNRDHYFSSIAKFISNTQYG